MVERAFPDGLSIPVTEEGLGITMQVTERNGLPIDRINRISVLDPSFCR
jgi:hypothetical protein